ncbi:hypothetical protein [Streptomyces ardesiacus]|uniref:hypothetical protein n=1 Tax=Streptomyces ardesiacus TaxID=285564 RepID=UPI00363E4416
MLHPAPNRPERVGLLRGDRRSVGERRRRCYELNVAARLTPVSERTAWQEFTTAIGSVLKPVTPPGVST